MIQLDAQIDRYERTVQTAFEAIGTVGGIYEIIKLSIGLLIKTYNHKVYEYTTAKNIKDGIEDEDNLNESNNDEDSKLDQNGVKRSQDGNSHAEPSNKHIQNDDSSLVKMKNDDGRV